MSQNINSCFFTTPYSATSFSNGKWSYQYWSLRVSITLVSTRRFFAGDIVKISSIDEENRVITIDAAEAEIVNPNQHPSLILVSNDIPLEEDDTYQFWYYGCERVVSFESKDQGNKIYTFALLVKESNACIKAYCRESKTRLSFQIFNNREA